MGLYKPYIYTEREVILYILYIYTRIHWYLVMFNTNLMLLKLHLKFLTYLIIHICMLNFSLFPPFSQCHIVSICVISLVVCEQLLWCVRRLRHLEIFLRKCNALLALLLLLLLSAITYLPANLTIPVLSPPAPFTSWISLFLSRLLTHAIRKTARQAGSTSFGFDIDFHVFFGLDSTRWHHSPSFSLSVYGSFIIIIPVSVVVVVAAASCFPLCCTYKTRHRHRHHDSICVVVALP